MPDLSKKLHDKRNQILFIELAGLLHDIGKLSKVFLEYRQEWQDIPNGWDIDPHDHEYLDKHEVYSNLIPSEFENYKIPANIDSGEENFSIKKAIDFHTKPGEDLILKLLKAADGLDSAIDRNNPLWSAEQKNKIFKSNVFGYEGNKIVTVESQEKARHVLYAFLGNMLPGYLDHFDSKVRIKILSGIKKAFDQGLSDTTRPQNDTTLWEHNYAVASILKVIVVRYILCNEKLDDFEFEKVEFGIFGIGWNGMRFLSYGQKIGDILGRQHIIEDIKRCLKDLIEYEYPIGNEIYSDDDGIYFIVPAKLDGYELKELRNKIDDEVYKIAAKASSGELQPHIVNISETNTLTSLAKAIQCMVEKTIYPFDSSVNGFDEYFKGALETFEDGKTVCPICRLRPVEKEDKKKKVCKTCMDRRAQNDKNDADKYKPKHNETLFIDEIVDKHRKAALIVARFGLDDWLKGTMVRSLFVTEASGLEKEINNLGNVKQFEAEEKKIKEYLSNRNYGEFNYGRIKDDIDALFKDKDFERAKNIAFLYDRRNTFSPDGEALKKIRTKWEIFLKAAKKEDSTIDIYNLLNAKTPTPSTLLDIWNTTLNFLDDLPASILNALLPEKRRLKLTVNNLDPNKYGRTLDGKVIFKDKSVKKIDILIINSNEIEVINETKSDSPTSKDWSNADIILTDPLPHLKVSKDQKGSSFVPYRTITATPNLFMSIVPADRAVEITNLIYQKYIEHFGKVMGRLPFSIGNIFFDRKMPMFVVLDAGKRMVDNFDKLSKQRIKFTALKDKESIPSGIKLDLKCTLGKLDKTLTWQLPSKLGNCEDDFHHSYFIVNNNKESLPDNRKSFFKTIAGNVVHCSEIMKGDELQVLPNYYDFEFLDSNIRRYDINLSENNRRKSNVANFSSKPFLLDELGQKIMCLWFKLLQGKQLKGITDTKLRNLQSLWLTKYQEWDVNISNNSSKNFNGWINLVLLSIRKEFNEINDKHYILLQETIKNGLFFDTLELYLGILKERIETK